MAGFLIPALALALPSGYSWGAVLLLLAALAAAPRWLRVPPAPVTWALVISFVAMAAVWLLEFRPGAELSVLDRPAKFLLVVPCLLFVTWCAPSARALGAGVVAGAIGAGLTALVQRQGCLAGLQSGGLFSTERCEMVRLFDRVSGYTNAIQFGDLGLLLALMCLTLLGCQWRALSVAARVICVGAVALGFEASLLSMARGGWLALLVVLPFAAYVALRWAPRRAAAGGALAVLALLGVLVAAKGNDVAERTRLAWDEVRQYQQQRVSDTSIGQRFAHWSLALDMAQQRPWTGWSQAGYEAEKARRVAAGEAPSVVLQFGHAHNEILDIFVKRGFVGLASLVVLYVLPLALFFPTQRRLRPVAGAGASFERTALALRVAGCLLPLAYMGFGLTQVFFAHNSGVMFYLFMVSLLHAALLRHEQRS